MKYYQCFITFTFSFQFIIAQTSFEQIHSAPNHYFQGLDVKQTSDEGFLILSAVSNTVDLFYTKANVIKLSKNGEIEWSKNYSFDTNLQKGGNLVLLEKDSFAFLVGEFGKSMNKILTKASPKVILIR